MSENKEKQEELLKNFVEQEESGGINDQIGPKIAATPDVKMPWMKDQSPLANQIGWIPLKIEDLPTRGLFYPKNTIIAIRSATGAEIRHWSTLDETDYSALDDMLNYVIERCVTIKTEDGSAVLSWKDIKEIDRFYIILAIHELTFVKGENVLQIDIGDGKKINVTKDMVKYVTLDPQVMRFYDENERCFVLKVKNSQQTIKLNIPSIGITQWIKQYILRKNKEGYNIDIDYLTFAPFVIQNWRGLSDDIYHRFIQDSHGWSITILSAITRFREIFTNAIDPVISYINEGGTELTAPLNFQGGIKSIFIVSDPFSELE